MEGSMNSIRLFALVAGFVLMMHVTPSLGQPKCHDPGCNPTASHPFNNTAGGKNALIDVDGSSGGVANTAFGDGAYEHDWQRQHHDR